MKLNFDNNTCSEDCDNHCEEKAEAQINYSLDIIHILAQALDGTLPGGENPLTKYVEAIRELPWTTRGNAMDLSERITKLTDEHLIIPGEDKPKPSSAANPDCR